MSQRFTVIFVDLSWCNSEQWSIHLIGFSRQPGNFPLLFFDFQLPRGLLRCATTKSTHTHTSPTCFAFSSEGLHIHCGFSAGNYHWSFFLSFSFLSQWEFFPWENRVALPEESQLRQNRATQPYLSVSLVYAVFLCGHTTGCWGLPLLRQLDMGSLTCTRSGVRHKQVCARVDSEGQKHCPSPGPCPARGSNPGSSDLNSYAVTTEVLRPP